MGKCPQSAWGDTWVLQAIASTPAPCRVSSFLLAVTPTYIASKHSRVEGEPGEAYEVAKLRPSG
jgi:hypothetical protein